MAGLGATSPPCIFCQTARSPTSTTLLHSVTSLSLSLSDTDKAPPVSSSSLPHADSARVLLLQDDRVVAFEDINPSALRHYLVIPVEHIPTVRDLRKRAEDYSLVSHMLDVGQMLLQQNVPQSNQYRSSRFSYPLETEEPKFLSCYTSQQPGKLLWISKSQLSACSS